jgi:hypothetical protein
MSRRSPTPRLIAKRNKRHWLDTPLRRYHVEIARDFFREHFPGFDDMDLETRKSHQFQVITQIERFFSKRGRFVRRPSTIIYSTKGEIRISRSHDSNAMITIKPL